MSGYGVIVKEKSKGKYRKNDGSTLITVLVGVSFMVVLASIILSVSFSNLKMKQLDVYKRQVFILRHTAPDPGSGSAEICGLQHAGALYEL